MVKRDSIKRSVAEKLLKLKKAGLYSSKYSDTFSLILVFSAAFY
jgi:hypothetical protein